MNTIVMICLLSIIGLFFLMDEPAFSYDYYDDKKYPLKKGTKIYLCCAVIILIISLLLDIKSFTMPYTTEKTSTEKIVALQDNNNVDGRFYLRRGTLETKLYYNYMVSLSGGGYKANKVPAQETTLYTIDNNYRVEWWKKERGYGLSHQVEKYWKIYIPKNSIVEDYTIDLQ